MSNARSPAAVAGAIRVGARAFFILVPATAPPARIAGERHRRSRRFRHGTEVRIDRPDPPGARCRRPPCRLGEEHVGTLDDPCRFVSARRQAASPRSPGFPARIAAGRRGVRDGRRTQGGDSSRRIGCCNSGPTERSTADGPLQGRITSLPTTRRESRSCSACAVSASGYCLDTSGLSLPSPSQPNSCARSRWLPAGSRLANSPQ